MKEVRDITDPYLIHLRDIDTGEYLGNIFFTHKPLLWEDELEEMIQNHLKDDPKSRRVEYYTLTDKKLSFTNRPY